MFTATCPMCGEGVQPSAGASTIVTCPNCGEVIPLPRGWGRPRARITAESWRAIHRGVGRMAVASGICVAGLPNIWLTWIAFAGSDFAAGSITRPVLVCGVAAVAAYLAHMLLTVGGLEMAAHGATALHCSKRGTAAAWLLKLTLIGVWCAPIVALFAAIPPPRMADFALTVLWSLLMAAAAVYGLAYAAACLFLRDLGRHIGDRHLPDIATTCAAVPLLLGVAAAVGIRWLMDRPTAIAPFAHFRASAVGLAGYVMLGLIAHHAIFLLLCWRASSLIETEIEFLPDAEAADSQAAEAEPMPPHRSSNPTTHPTPTE